jgi:4a-hydroxytetrahydrobiopterin dehydratase
MKPELLSDEAVQRLMAALPTWRVEGRELVKEFRFPSYLAGIEFVRQAADFAEALNHHPDLYVGWRKVTVRLSTHSAGGLTKLDFDLASQITTLESSSTTLT